MRRAGGGAASLTSARGLRPEPGHMMMDWVSPARRGMRPLILRRPSAGVLHGRTGRPDRPLAGAGRGGTPSADDGAPSRTHPRPPVITSLASHRGERVVAGLGQQVACLPYDLAGLRQGGPLAVD